MPVTAQMHVDRKPIDGVKSHFSVTQDTAFAALDAVMQIVAECLALGLFQHPSAIGARGSRNTAQVSPSDMTNAPTKKNATQSLVSAQ